MNVSRRRALESAVAAGLRYLLRRQTAQGCWSDWSLPAGSAVAWTTAYVGSRLQALPRELAERSLSARALAARWLGANITPGWGWGYGEPLGTDAASTAYATLFLAREGAAVAHETYRCLLSFQASDGGFSAYHREPVSGSWGAPQADITAPALQALLTRYSPSHPAVAAGVAYLRRQRRATGLWESFWWNGPMYATEAALALFEALDGDDRRSLTRKHLLLLERRGAFDTALFLAAAMRLGMEPALPAVAAAIDHLAAEQAEDGSWVGAPMLRLTDRSCYDPWENANAGRLYSDPNRLFTTATVIHALGLTARRLSASERDFGPRPASCMAPAIGWR
jgi:hypothetical protein